MNFEWRSLQPVRCVGAFWASEVPGQEEPPEEVPARRSSRPSERRRVRCHRKSGSARELVGAAREGLLALSVGVGLGVVHELMEAEVTEVVGPKGKHNPDRVSKRHGHQDGSMTLGGRRVAVSRPRMRTTDDEHELPVATYGYFADRDPLTARNGSDARRRLEPSSGVGGARWRRGRGRLSRWEARSRSVHRATRHRAR